MKVVYIAGHYRDERGEFYVRCNIREAERCALIVWLNGGVAMCPHKNTAGLGGAHGILDTTWLDGDLELLSRCDALWAIPGWDTSTGAKREVEYAKADGIPVFTEQIDVINFLKRKDGK